MAGASPPVHLRTLQRRHSRTDAGSSDNEVLPPPTVSSSGSPGDGGGHTGPVSPGTGPPRLTTGVLGTLFGTRNASQPLANVAATDPRMPAPANGTRAQQGDPSDPVFRGWSQSPAEQHRQDESSPHGGGPHGGALASSDPLERRRAQCAAEREHEHGHSGVTVASIRWQFVSMPFVFTVFIILAGLTKLPGGACDRHTERLDFAAWRRRALFWRPAESAEGSAKTLPSAQRCIMDAHAQRCAISGPAPAGRCRTRSPESTSPAL
ncbi:sodium/hydrogen exchanger 2 [Ixodes scapularis]